MDSDLVAISEELAMIQEDNSIPRSVRDRVGDVMQILSAEGDVGVRVDKSLEQLSSVAEDPNIPSYVRMQLWSLLSSLEASERN